MSYRTESQFTTTSAQLSARPVRFLRKLIPVPISRFLGNLIAPIIARAGRWQMPLSERWLLLFTGDLFLLTGVITGAYILSGAELGLNIALLPWPTHWPWSLLLLGGWWLLAHLNDLYDIRSAHLRRITSVRLLLVGLQAGLLYGVLVYVFGEQLPPPYFFALVMLVLPLIWLWRLVYATCLYAWPFRNGC